MSVRRWRPHSAGDRAGRGTGVGLEQPGARRLQAPRAGPLSRPPAHRRQAAGARHSRGQYQRQGAGGTGTQPAVPSGGGHGTASARRRRARAWSDEWPEPQGHLRRGWPGTGFRPQTGLLHPPRSALPDRPRVRTLPRGPPLAKRACHGRCRRTVVSAYRVEATSCLSLYLGQLAGAWHTVGAQ